MLPHLWLPLSDSPVVGDESDATGALAAENAANLRSSCGLPQGVRPRDVRWWAAPYDAILTPPTTGEAPGPDTTGDARFCSRWSLAGAPAITVPTGLGP